MENFRYLQMHLFNGHFTVVSSLGICLVKYIVHFVFKSLLVFQKNINIKQSQVFPNIFLKNHAILSSPTSSKETGFKVLKLP